MVAQFVGDLQSALSTDRLGAYRPSGGDDLAMVTTYFWNKELCRALYTCLGSLEVVLRNGINTALTQHLRQLDWYDAGGLLSYEQSKIDDAKDKIRKAKAAEVAQGIDPVTPGRVIAALSFGFWTNILDAGYGNSPKGPQYWTPATGLLAVAFPHAPAHLHIQRRRLHHTINNLRLLRNRVFHYEPIWNGVLLPSYPKGQPAQIVSVMQLHSEIIDVIGWVSPTLQGTIKAMDTFPHMQLYGRRNVRRKLNKHLRSLGLI